MISNESPILPLYANEPSALKDLTQVHTRVHISRSVFISSRLPNSPLFLIWEIILKSQIASLSAQDLTSKLETRA